MTSKHVIRESESPRPAASSILISRMTRSSVIIPYLMLQETVMILASIVWEEVEVNAARDGQMDGQPHKWL